MTAIRLRAILLYVLVWLLMGCGGATGEHSEAPTALPEIRYRDALPLMLEAQDLGLPPLSLPTQSEARPTRLP